MRKNSINCIYCSNEDFDYPFNNLFGSTTSGWISRPNPKYPIKAVINLGGDYVLNGLQIVSHESMIPTRIDIYVSNNPELDGITIDSNNFFEYQNQFNWRNAGFFCFSSNERSNWVAREFKKVILPKIQTSYILLSISKCYKDIPGNFYNKVSIISLNFMGTLIYRPRFGLSLIEMYDDLVKAKNSAIKVENFTQADLITIQIENTKRNQDILNSLFHKKQLALENEEFMVADSIIAQIFSIINQPIRPQQSAQLNQQQQQQNRQRILRNEKNQTFVENQETVPPEIIKKEEKQAIKNDEKESISNTKNESKNTINKEIQIEEEDEDKVKEEEDKDDNKAKEEEEQEQESNEDENDDNEEDDEEEEKSAEKKKSSKKPKSAKKQNDIKKSSSSKHDDNDEEDDSDEEDEEDNGNDDDDDDEDKKAETPKKQKSKDIKKSSPKKSPKNEENHKDDEKVKPSKEQKKTPSSESPKNTQLPNENPDEPPSNGESNNNTVDPLSDEAIRESEYLIQLFGENPVAMAYSENWEVKSNGLITLCDKIKNLKDKNTQKDALQSMLPLFHKMFSSKLKATYVQAADQLIKLIDELKENGTFSGKNSFPRKMVRPLLNLSLLKLSNSNAHINKASMKFVRWASKADKTLMVEVAQFALKPPQKQRIPIMEMNKLDLLDEMIKENNDILANKLEIKNVMQFFLKCLESPNEDVRGKAIKFYVTCREVYGKKVTKYIEDLPKTIKSELIAATEEKS